MASMSLQVFDRFVDADRHAVLATNRSSGPPQLTPVWYLYEDGRFYVSAVDSTVKVHNLRRDPSMTLCIDGCRGDSRYVVASGTATLIEPGHGIQAEMRKRIIRRYHSSDEEAERYYETAKKNPAVLIVLDPERIISQDDS